jgi:hypothetical protein
LSKLHLEGLHRAGEGKYVFTRLRGAITPMHSVVDILVQSNILPMILDLLSG